MYQAAAKVWNDLAASQPISSLWRPLMQANPAEMGHLLAKRGKEAGMRGLDDKTVRAYLLVGPLLTENEAVSQFLMESGQPHLRSALPELTTVREALTLAQQEFRLTRPQLEALWRVLREDLETLEKETPSDEPAA